MTNTPAQQTVTRLYARLVVPDGPRAIDFYRAALGAEEIERYTGPDGRIVHALLRLGGAVVAVKDADEADPAPASLGGSPVIMALDVSDADAVAEAMLRGGASVVYPVADQHYGQRGGRLADPFGHLWMISQTIEDLTPEQIQQRTDELLA
ncbi:VOC family protein [Streptomyces paradoxus]|uniref:Putative glyoxalase superfamily protein PhnB n=1 Tax=Streptomyces paradoxus TaxID=66375 RepID=A0A7W9T6A4_9ACTN|nr:VOC family protein [Streptomyces paradoxus]MBB6074909.1 putative glyoxalase superfamily protein PhnB [Streptomyces paradoxus]